MLPLKFYLCTNFCIYCKPLKMQVPTNVTVDYKKIHASKDALTLSPQEKKKGILKKKKNATTFA